MSDQLRCKRCTRVLNAKTVVHTRAGSYCKKHADRLPPHLRRTPLDRKENAR